MTIEDLMKPRYKVIADYPQPPFTNDLYNVDNEHIFIEGDLLVQCNVNGALTFKRYGRLGHMSVGVPCCAHPEKFPKIFKKLEWWEDRKPEDMPLYIKYWDTSLYFPVDRVCKGSEAPFKDTWTSSNFQPATLEEYNAYINKQ